MSSIPRGTMLFTLIAVLVSTSVGKFANGQSDVASELLQKMKKVDDEIKLGFTAEGTKVAVPFERIGSNHPPTRVRWKFSISGEQFAYEEKVQEVLRWEDLVGPEGQVPTRDVRYATSSFDLWVRVVRDRRDFAEMSYFAERIPKPGKIIPVTDEDPGLSNAGSVSRYLPARSHRHGYPNDILWSMGRGYTPFIKRITSVEELEDGDLRVVAQGSDEFRNQWELVIDPEAGYLVRNAKFYWSEEDIVPSIEIHTVGTKQAGGVRFPESYTLKDDSEYDDSIKSKIGGKFLRASAKVDAEFLKRTRAILKPPYSVRTAVADERGSGAAILTYDAGESVPQQR